MAPEQALKLSSLTNAGPPTPKVVSQAPDAPLRRPCPRGPSPTPPREDAPDWQRNRSSKDRRTSDHSKEPRSRQSRHDKRAQSPALGGKGSIWLTGSRNSRGCPSPAGRSSPTLAWQIFHGSYFRLNQTPGNQTGNVQRKHTKMSYFDCMTNFGELIAKLDGFPKLLAPYCRAADIVRLQRTCRVMKMDCRFSPDDVQRVAEQQRESLYPQPGAAKLCNIRSLAALNRAGTCSTQPWAIVRFGPDEFDVESLSAEVKNSLLKVVSLQTVWPGLAAICEGHSKPCSAVPVALQASRSRAESVRATLEQLGCEEAAAIGWGGLGKAVKRDTSSIGDCVEVRLVRKDDPLWTRATWRQTRQGLVHRALAMAVTNPASPSHPLLPVHTFGNRPHTSG